MSAAAAKQSANRAFTSVVSSESGLEAWKKKLIDDGHLNCFDIGYAIGLTRFIDRDDWRVKTDPMAMCELLGISRATHYGKLETLENHGYLVQMGTHMYSRTKRDYETSSYIMVLPA